MCKSSVWLCVLFSTFFSAVASGAPEQVLQTAARINYKGINFNSTFNDAEKTFPTATVNHAHPGSNEGVTTLEIWNDPIIDSILLRFSSNQLIEIQYVYFPTKVAMMGGASKINALALQEYGQPTQKNEVTMQWDFPSIDRIIEVSEANGKWTQRVLHRSRYLAFDVYPATTATPRTSGIHVASGPSGPIPNTSPRTTRVSADQVIASDIAMPKDIREAIERNARLDHSDNKAQQAYTVVQQSESYASLMRLACPDSFEAVKFRQLKATISSDHPFDYSTQLHVLRQQISAYGELRELEPPEGMARSHFYSLKQSAESRHPDDYSTQLYVLRRNMDKYLHLRRSGNSGEAIVRHLLK